jgi:hypothetical protein
MKALTKTGTPVKKTRWILLSVVLAVSAAFAGDVGLRVVGDLYGLPSNKTTTLTTNATRVVYVNWDGPGKAAGGHYEIRAHLRGDSIVLIEESLSANGGPVNHTTSTKTFKTNLLPQTLTFEQTTVTVFRVEQDVNK